MTLSACGIRAAVRTTASRQIEPWRIFPPVHPSLSSAGASRVARHSITSLRTGSPTRSSSLVKRAKSRDGRVFGNIAVPGILTGSGWVKGVETDRGVIRCPNRTGDRRRRRAPMASAVRVAEAPVDETSKSEQSVAARSGRSRTTRGGTPGTVDWYDARCRERCARPPEVLSRGGRFCDGSRPEHSTASQEGAR